MRFRRNTFALAAAIGCAVNAALIFGMGHAHDYAAAWFFVVVSCVLFLSLHVPFRFAVVRWIERAFGRTDPW